MSKYIRPIKLIILPLMSAKIVMCDNYVKLKKYSNSTFTLHYYDEEIIKINHGSNRAIKPIYPYSSEANIFHRFNEHQYKYKHYDDFNSICKILLPEDNPFFSKIYFDEYCIANAINLKETYDLSNIKDIEYILNNINNDTHYYVFMASRKGNVDMLAWLHKNYKKSFNYDDAIDQAMIHKKIKVLDWFEKEGYKIKYKESTLTEVIRLNNIEILEWLKKHGCNIDLSNIPRGLGWVEKNISTWLKG